MLRSLGNPALVVLAMLSWIFWSHPTCAQTPCIPKGKAVTSYRMDLPANIADSLSAGGNTAMKLEILLPLALPAEAQWMGSDGKKKSLGANSTSIPLGTFTAKGKTIPSSVYLILPTGKNAFIADALLPELKIELRKPGGQNYHGAQGIKSFKGKDSVTENKLALNLIPETLPICDDPPVSKDCADCKATEDSSQTTQTTEVLKKDTTSHVNDSPAMDVQTAKRRSLKINPNLKPCGDCGYYAEEIFLKSVAPLLPALHKMRQAVIQTKKCPENKAAIQGLLNLYLAKLPAKEQAKVRKETQAALNALTDLSLARTADEAGLYKPSPFKKPMYRDAKFIECGLNVSSGKYMTIRSKMSGATYRTDHGSGCDLSTDLDEDNEGGYSIWGASKKTYGSYCKFRFIELTPGILMSWGFDELGIYNVSILFQQ